MLIEEFRITPKHTIKNNLTEMLIEEFRITPKRTIKNNLTEMLIVCSY